MFSYINSSVYQHSSLLVGIGTGFLVGIGTGVIPFLLIAILNGLEIGTLSTRILPNEGLHRSQQSALICGLIVGLVVGPAVGMVVSLALGPSVGLVVGVIAALGTSVPTALVNGGFASIQHYTLRSLLVRYGYAPWNYIAFLDSCAERILLRKVGGGYIFVHRLLLEYFASLHESQPLPNKEAP